ncbi:DUF5677 domain-containing protein [Cellulophaga sp. F20128]|uniref:DUF5677 domain-containing protein n=1 Tax=Cellulophaga sp. F20128 TaxID=2926413 RepID=UPI001FF5870B|nr:DUF5677 domain-containing protein [Cellulophaga sp. F20128]MCK0158230.1 DUF5677 domain-containing protein [Cellulophaga sp. F20128]
MKKQDSIDEVPDFILPDKESILNLRDLIVQQMSFFEKLLDQNGKVVCITKKQNEVEFKDIFQDFINFGIFKSYKSCSASLLLAENFLKEDSQIIIRTIYENYLAIKYVSKTPQAVFHFTYKDLGVSANLLSHPVSKNGRMEKNKIVNPNTGNIESFGLGVSKMAASLESENEVELHKSFYPYLCEHTHLNMISSGNYRTRENNKYIYDSLEGYYNPFVYLGYMLTLIIDYLISEAGISNQNLSKKMLVQNKKIKKELIQFLSQYDKEKSIRGLVENMIKRLKEERKLKNLMTKSVSYEKP